MLMSTKYKNMSVEIPPQKILYLFIDESGNFDFSPKGTKYFVLTGFITFNPLFKREDLVKLCYELLASGVDQDYFHASEDAQATRDKVFSILGSLGNNFEVRSVVARKNKVNPSLINEYYAKKGKMIKRSTGMGLYEKLCDCLLKYIFRGRSGTVNKIVVVLGSLYTGDKSKILLQTLKRSLKQNFPGIPFEIYCHQACVDLNCQLADYCCWAIAVMAERKEARPYQIIKPQVKSVFDIFKNGDHEYYQYEK